MRISPLRFLALLLLAGIAAAPVAAAPVDVAVAPATDRAEIGKDLVLIVTVTPAAGATLVADQVTIDVQATGRASRAMTDCVVEVAWAVELTWNFEAERLTRALSLP